VPAATRTIDTSDGAMELYEAVPDGEARGAVIVIQEAFGVNEHIQDVARRFADVGYTAVAPALFHRAGGGTADYTDFPTVMKLFEGLTDADVLIDIEAALAHLETLGFARSRIAVVGFCIGGRFAFLAAAELLLGAAVSFYPGGLVEPGGLPLPAVLDKTAELKTPWLSLFGAEDASIPAEQVTKLNEALVGVTAVDHEVVVYPDAGHAFHCDARPQMYRPEAAQAGWAAALQWLDKHLHH
jgi:carboxymethylenebutenolidase